MRHLVIAWCANKIGVSVIHRSVIEVCTGSRAVQRRKRGGRKCSQKRPCEEVCICMFFRVISCVPWTLLYMRMCCLGALGVEATCSAQFSEDMRCAEVGPRQAYQLIDQALIVLSEVTTFLVLLRNWRKHVSALQFCFLQSSLYVQKYECEQNWKGKKIERLAFL